jgi:hypothetical protein
MAVCALGSVSESRPTVGLGESDSANTSALPSPSIAVASEKGAGSAFTVHLPLAADRVPT